jgi:hypothetical protein
VSYLFKQNNEMSKRQNNGCIKYRRKREGNF